ncbi:MAG: hypothetical protein FWG02_10565 [Holophagaceae bacterium]|nr:hypothetical protein [Holophagaceae bacterium]
MITLRSTLPSQVDSIFVSNGDVYVTGRAGGQALIWKNGECLYHLNESCRTKGWPVFASDADVDGFYSEEKCRAWATSVFVSGKDVYAAGIEDISQENWAATLWKNGEVLHRLNNGELDAHNLTVFASHGKIRVVGLVNEDKLPPAAILWENGKESRRYTLEEQELEEPESAFASSVFALDDDVYLSGFDCYYAGEVALVWKNGELLHRFTCKAGTAEISSIAVSDGDLYSVGFELKGGRSTAVVWKNGDVLYRIPSKLYHSRAETVYILDKDVYVTGFVGRDPLKGTAMVWKNGEAIYSLTDGNSYVGTGSILVSGSNVYVSGYETFDKGSDSIGRLWKNGENIELSCCDILTYPHY